MFFAQRSLAMSQAIPAGQSALAVHAPEARQLASGGGPGVASAARRLATSPGSQAAGPGPRHFPGAARSGSRLAIARAYRTESSTFPRPSSLTS